MTQLDAIIGWQVWWLSGWVIVPVFIALGVVGGALQDLIRRGQRVPGAEDVRRGALIGRWGAAAFVVGVAAYVAVYFLSR